MERRLTATAISFCRERRKGAIMKSSNKWELGIIVAVDENSPGIIVDMDGKIVENPYMTNDMPTEGCFNLVDWTNDSSATQ